MPQILKSLPARLLLAIGVGIVIGLLAGDGVINVVQSIRHISGQVVFFAVPLIIVGFVAPAIASMGARASKLLGFALATAYASAVGAGVLAAIAGYSILPWLNVADEAVASRPLPAIVFELNIPQIMPAMSALALALSVGLAVAWTKAERIAGLLDELHTIVLVLVRKVVIPVLPVFIAGVFAQLAFQGRITEQIPVFLGALGVIVVIQLVWIAVTYLVAGAYAKSDPLQVVRHYGPAYLTAVGTMSSAATLAVALKGAHASPVLGRKAVGFGVPLFAHVHMPGSVVSITFLALTASQVLYGTLPPVGTVALFVVLLGIFAVAAPGVPGGTLMASLGLIYAVLGFDETGTALMLAIFALQDSFGTATNITADGALTLALSRFARRRGLDDELAEAGAAAQPEVPVLA